MTKFKSIALIGLAGVFLQSCSNDDDGPNNDPENGNYSKGVFILNEGDYNSSNAEITYFDPTKDVSTTNPIQEVFKKANSGAQLGSVAQSMYFKGNKAYIVLNVSNKVEIVDNTTFKKISTIPSSENMNNPRYIVSDDQFLYISNWGDPKITTDDFIAKYKISDLTFVEKYKVDEGPEKMILDNNKLYVAQKGGWGIGKTVTIIDLKTTDKKSINVGEVPTDLTIQNGNLFVLSQGISWETSSKGKLVRYNLTSEDKLEMNFAAGQYPNFLVAENSKLYYILNNSVYSMATNATALPTKADYITGAENVYGFNVKGDTFYVLDSKDNKSSGRLFIQNAQGGLKYQTIITGLFPNSVYIK
ncbi:hypothetical protein HXZ94_03020 [Empedobacter falsenii]|uniref:DUF5074 domain-containing protein n=1 Tax=Empedobacter falsenii TaxID=343874 RepID=UPI002574B5BA|nr:DUF5074 domain-containing protein [Empedobacter falsenii]MDM1297476.1 hypothetical protein [Empedobacter falsenii]MDM1317270.1 hypothetical protein [Empedobacter falsenii]